ncbi:MAG: 4-hydroxybenzoate octaprenyltransferase [Phycisphaerales bacterium]
MEHTIAQPPNQLTWLHKARIAMGDIKLAHSVFALPFAILGALIADAHHQSTNPQSSNHHLPLTQLILIVICMVFARNWAMLVNRVADAKLDADNARTARRAFASGVLSRRDGYLMLAFNAIAFIITCSLFGILENNWWPTILSVPVLAWIGFYSFTKRFTYLCHIFLGGALAASPLAAAIAIDPHTLSDAYALYWLSAMVLCWVAGFDMIYALQDLEHDQHAGISSIPSRFGWKRAAGISRLMHLLAIACLVGAWRSEPRFSTIFFIAILASALVLIYEHLTLAKRGKAGIPMAFFTLNGIISIILGIAGSIDLFI